MTYIDYVPVEKKVTHLQPMEEVTSYVPVLQQEPTYNYMPVQGFQEKVVLQPVKSTVPLPYQRFVPTDVYQSQLQGQQQPQYQQPPQQDNQSHVPINETNHIGRGDYTHNLRKRNDYDTLN